jgi:DNA-binding NtrC family response regulator
VTVQKRRKLRTARVGQTLSGVHVLVVDDDIAVAEVMRVVLVEADFDVTVVHRASDVPTERFDCIVTDLISVDLYSFEDARDWLLRLADRHPGTPVIVATAHAEAGRDAARLGVRVLLKPFDVDELVDAVREVTR